MGYVSFREGIYIYIHTRYMNINTKDIHPKSHMELLSSTVFLVIEGIRPWICQNWHAPTLAQKTPGVIGTA